MYGSNFFFVTYRQQYNKYAILQIWNDDVGWGMSYGSKYIM